jgi:protein gp37
VIVTKSNISWCDSTLNAVIGCSKVSAGCDSCYASRLVTINRGNVFRKPFDEPDIRLERLQQLRKLGPIREADGNVRPRMIFTNSISDIFWEKVPDDVIHKQLDAFEQHPRTVFQLLSKRPIRARKLLVDRYSNSGVPANLWIGFSVEQNQVAARLNVLRSIKDRTGGNMTAFVSVEPLIGPSNEIDFTGIDWCILGGESGPGARIMQRQWLLDALGNAEKAGSRIWLKQHGTMHSHPNLSETPSHWRITERFKWLVANGWEHLPDEKGGATADHTTWRDLPLSYDRLKAKLSDTLL